MAYYNRPNPFMRAGVIQNIGQDGQPADITQGGGIGIRAHDDVMLSWGYSHKVTQFVEIPGRDWAVITLTIPPDLVHHAEKRFAEAYDGQLDIKLIAGLVEGDLPSVVNQIPAFNQVGPVRNDNVQSIFHWRGVHTSNPITATIDDNNTVDHFRLYGQSGNSRTASSTGSSNVSGRWYQEGIWTVLIENLINSTVEFTYIYEWHEY